MPKFKPSEYLIPKTLEDALSLLQKYGEKAKIIGGGTQVYETAMRGMIPNIDKLVDISRLGLDYVEEDKDQFRIGAMTSFTTLLRSSTFKKVPYSVIPETIFRIKTPQIRNMATIGGTICSGLPQFDLPVTLLSLDAKLNVLSQGEQKVIPLDGFFLDYFLTVLKPTELVKEVLIPKLPPRTGTAFEKMERTAVDLALANAAATVTLNERGQCGAARLSMGSMGTVPLRIKKVEKMLEDKVVDGKLIAEAETVLEVKPMAGVHASVEYKKRMSRVILRRVLTRASQAAKGG